MGMSPVVVGEPTRQLLRYDLGIREEGDLDVVALQGAHVVVGDIRLVSIARKAR